METVKAIKTTFKTAEKLGFDRSELDEEMTEYGYTTRDNKELNVIELIDENGELLDMAKPYRIHYAGAWFGMIMWGERENVFVASADKEYSESDGQIERND